jgi:hypothetical protein
MTPGICSKSPDRGNQCNNVFLFPDDLYNDPTSNSPEDVILFFDRINPPSLKLLRDRQDFEDF